MSTELIYQETHCGLKAELHCAVARMECIISIYQSGHIDGKVTLHSNGTQAVLYTGVPYAKGEEGVEEMKHSQRNAINRFLNQKWNPA